MDIQNNRKMACLIVNQKKKKNVVLKFGSKWVNMLFIHLR